MAAMTSPRGFVQGDSLEGLLVLDVLSCHGLPAMDLNGKADPFFVVQFTNKEVYKSKVIKKTKEPVWNESVKLLVSHSERKYTVTILVYDWDKASSNDWACKKRKKALRVISHMQSLVLKHDYIGTAYVDLASLTVGNSVDLNVALVNTKKEKKHDLGTIQMRAKFMDKSEVDKEFWASFAKHFDTDDSGSINRVEFGAMIGAIHPTLTEAEITSMFDKVDKNSDGELSFEEAFVMFTTDTTLTATMMGSDPNFIWHIYAQSDDYRTVGDLVLNKNLVHTQPVTVDKADRKVIMVHSRETKKLEEEKIPHYIEVSLRIMYSTGSGRIAVENSQIKKLLSHLSIKQGKKYNDPRSKKEIEPFINFHKLNVDEILEPIESFANFNEFFFRKLKASARPISEPDDPRVAVSPADCRMLVFPKIEDATAIWIKGKNFTLKNLLDDDALVAKFAGGSLVIARLAPQDYHRFHLPVDCTVGSTKHFDGALYTVNPIAIREHVDVYTENKREFTVLENTAFVPSLVSVGATMVGSIVLTSKQGQTYKKGDEHGFFAFGGSTVLLLFEPNKINFKQSILVNSQKPIETLVKMGSKIGTLNQA